MRGIVDRGEEVELPFRLVAATIEHAVDDRLVDEQQALAGMPEGVERARLHQRLDGALVQDRRVDAVAEVVEVGEGTTLLPRRHDVHDDAFTHVADRRKAEADRFTPWPVAHREVGERLVDVGDEHLDPQLPALVEEDGGLVLVGLDAGEQRGEVFDRMVRLQPGGLVGDVAVPHRVRLVERVVGERLDGVEDALAELLRVTLR